jgi:hypothetical protein
MKKLSECQQAIADVAQRKGLIAQWTVDLSTMLHQEGVQFNPELTSLGELERQLVCLGKITIPVTT